MIEKPEQPPNLIRVKAFLILVIIGAFILSGRLWYLQIAHGEELYEISMNNQLRLIRRIAPRGEIVDAEGDILATNHNEIMVSVAPDIMQKNPGMLNLLAKLLHTDPQSIQAMVEKNKIDSYDPVRIADNVDLATATCIEERKTSLPGVIVSSEPVRYYPNGPLFGHILGQMGQIQRSELNDGQFKGYRPGDYCGKLGLERAYDTYLHGTDGGRIIQVDARGRMKRQLGETDPIVGDTLTLNINKSVQEAAYNGLMAQVAKGHPGAAVALDPNNGAVIALVSAPSYDPNQFARGISFKNWNAISKNPLKPQINRAVSSAYAPGSTFKVVVSSAALNTGTITPSTTFVCHGVMWLGKWPKYCWKRSGHGPQDLIQAIAHSCDIYFYHVGLLLGPDKIAQYAKRFGLGKKTGVDLARKGDLQIERTGTVPFPAWKRKYFHQSWVEGNTVDYAIGQAMLTCTPIQMCNVVSAIANGGTLYRPQIVRTITQYDRNNQPDIVHEMKPEVIGDVGLSPQTISIVTQGMEAVMQPGGTGANSRIPGITIAAKTGTAQMLSHGRLVDNSWFVCFAPVDHPKIAICVFVQGGGEGGVTCAPIAKNMMEAYFNIAKPAPKAVNKRSIRNAIRRRISTKSPSGVVRRPKSPTKPVITTPAKNSTGGF